MDAAEVMQAGQAAWGNALASGAALTTLLSGYLIVAYVVGRELSRSQIVIVNTLYVLVFSFTLLGAFTFALRASQLTMYAVELSDHRFSRSWPEFAVVLLSLYLFALAASLKFMWDIRHKAKEA